MKPNLRNVLELMLCKVHGLKSGSKLDDVDNIIIIDTLADIHALMPDVKELERTLDKSIMGKALSGRWVRWSKNIFGITTYLTALNKTAKAIYKRVKI